MSSTIEPELDRLVSTDLETAPLDRVQSETSAAVPAREPKRVKSTFYQSLDMWRGMACLMLVFYHCTFYAELAWRTFDPSTWTLGSLALNLVTRLWIGVPMFFVVSGYCIAASVDSLRRKPQSLTTYFIRRFRRIYPPLWASLAFAVAFVLVAMYAWPEAFAHCAQLPRLADFSVRAWIGNLTASESWLATLTGNSAQYILLNTWTLCYEEQFYFVTGAILLFSARRFFRLAAVVTAVVFVARFALTAFDIPVAGFFFDGHWLMFAMGILVYRYIKYRRNHGQWGTWAVICFGVGYGLAMRVLCHDPHDRHLGEYIAVASAFAAALIALKPSDSAIANHWLAQPFIWCGKISYSIYLTHFVVVVFAASVLATWGLTNDGWVVLAVTPLCVALSLGVGWVFYMLVERHFVNQPEKT